MKNKIAGDNMFNVVSVVFKYIFIIIMYLFIYIIVKMIYLDIKNMQFSGDEKSAYLKLINRKDTLPFKIREVYMIDKLLTIGRARNNNVIIKDPYVSKEHSRIILDENNYYIEDLGSANGTYINGEKILDVTVLSDGDRIRIGNIEFLFIHKEV